MEYIPGRHEMVRKEPRRESSKFGIDQIETEPRSGIESDSANPHRCGAGIIGSLFINDPMGTKMECIVIR